MFSQGLIILDSCGKTLVNKTFLDTLYNYCKLASFSLRLVGEGTILTPYECQALLLLTIPGLSFPGLLKFSYMHILSVISWILKGNPVKISVVIPVEKLSPLQSILTILFSPVFQHHLLNPSWASLDFPYSASDLLSSNTASIRLPVLFLVPAFFLVNRNSFFLQAQLPFPSYGPSVVLVSSMFALCLMEAVGNAQNFSREVWPHPQPSSWSLVHLGELLGDWCAHGRPHQR